MHPQLWGPIGHDFILFMIAESYPETPNAKQQAKMEATLSGIFDFLPCQSPCSNNANKYYNLHPFRYTSRQELLEDYVAFHNHINATKINPSRSDWTVLEALQAAHSRYGTSLRSLDRAMQMRAEDHKLLQEVVEENNTLRTQLGKSWRKDIENTNGLYDPKKKNQMNVEFSKYFEPYDPTQWRVDPSGILIAVVAVFVLFIVMMAILG